MGELRDHEIQCQSESMTQVVLISTSRSPCLSFGVMILDGGIDSRFTNTRSIGTKESDRVDSFVLRL